MLVVTMVTMTWIHMLQTPWWQVRREAGEGRVVGVGVSKNSCFEHICAYQSISNFLYILQGRRYNFSYILPLSVIKFTIIHLFLHFATKFSSNLIKFVPYCLAMVLWTGQTKNSILSVLVCVSCPTIYSDTEVSIGYSFTMWGQLIAIIGC